MPMGFCSTWKLSFKQFLPKNILPIIKDALGTTIRAGIILMRSLWFTVEASYKDSFLLEQA